MKYQTDKEECYGCITYQYYLLSCKQIYKLCPCKECLLKVVCKEPCEKHKTLVKKK